MNKTDDDGADQCQQPCNKYTHTETNIRPSRHVAIGRMFTAAACYCCCSSIPLLQQQTCDGGVCGWLIGWSRNVWTNNRKVSDEHCALLKHSYSIVTYFILLYYALLCRICGRNWLFVYFPRMSRRNLIRTNAI